MVLERNLSRAYEGGEMKPSKGWKRRSELRKALGWAAYRVHQATKRRLRAAFAKLKPRHE